MRHSQKYTTWDNIQKIIALKMILSIPFFIMAMQEKPRQIVTLKEMALSVASPQILAMNSPAIERSLVKNIEMCFKRPIVKIEQKLESKKSIKFFNIKTGKLLHKADQKSVFSGDGNYIVLIGIQRLFLLSLKDEDTDSEWIESEPVGGIWVLCHLSDPKVSIFADHQIRLRAGTNLFGWDKASGKLLYSLYGIRDISPDGMHAISVEGLFSSASAVFGIYELATGKSVIKEAKKQVIDAIFSQDEKHVWVVSDNPAALTVYTLSGLACSAKFTDKFDVKSATLCRSKDATSQSMEIVLSIASKKTLRRRDFFLSSFHLDHLSGNGFELFCSCGFYFPSDLIKK